MALCHAQIHEVNLNLSRSLNMIWVLSSGITGKIKFQPVEKLLAELTRERMSLKAQRVHSRDESEQKQHKMKFRVYKGKDVKIM